MWFRQSIDFNFSALFVLLAPGCMKEINDYMTKVHEYTLVPVLFCFLYLKMIFLAAHFCVFVFHVRII